MSVALAEMDVKLLPYVIFFVCVFFGLQNVSAQITNFPHATFTTAAPEGECKTTYTTCSLDLGLAGSPGKTGEKGERGIQGIQGEPGIKGAKGEAGVNGINGLQGLKGEPGENGKEGLQGPPGVPGKNGTNGADGLQGPAGIPGEKGTDGSLGMPGIPGAKGDRGEDGKIGPAGPMGSPGPVGPPGIPGSPGVYPCTLPITIIDTNELDMDNFGQKDNPAEVPCKSAASDMASGTYFLGPPGDEMKVYCNMTTLETCIRSSNATPECNHKSSKGGSFWLNEMKVHMTELYNSISVAQLTWLRDRSNNVRQTLKYNCLNSVPYNKHNMSASVKLWAWNDVVIGPYPTNESPIFYSVPEATDHCEAGTAEWKSTIIELQSSNVYRLPIVDLWIGDIRQTELQKMSIESVELCFS